MSGVTTTTLEPDQALETEINTNLIAKATELAPLLSKHADEASRLTRPADEVIEALEAAGMFKLVAPRARGCHQVTLGTFNRGNTWRQALITR